MKISGIMNSCTVNPYRSYTKSTKAVKQSASTDSLEISNDAFELYIEKQDVREEKVQDIKSRIAAGSYMINSTDIVDKMMEGFRI